MLYQRKRGFVKNVVKKKVNKENRCNNKVNENKEFEANLNQVKREEFGHMLPYFEE